MKIKDIKDEKIKGKAVQYAVGSLYNRTKLVSEILELDLMSAFSWAKTSEGGGYWNNVDDGRIGQEQPKETEQEVLDRYEANGFKMYNVASIERKQQIIEQIQELINEYNK